MNPLGHRNNHPISSRMGLHRRDIREGCRIAAVPPRAADVSPMDHTAPSTSLGFFSSARYDWDERTKTNPRKRQ
jgi:hypothetical protein